MMTEETAFTSSPLPSPPLLKSTAEESAQLTSNFDSLLSKDILSECIRVSTSPSSSTQYINCSELANSGNSSAEGKENLPPLFLLDKRRFSSTSDICAQSPRLAASSSLSNNASLSSTLSRTNSFQEPSILGKLSIGVEGEPNTVAVFLSGLSSEKVGSPFSEESHKALLHAPYFEMRTSPLLSRSEEDISELVCSCSDSMLCKFCLHNRMSNISKLKEESITNLKEILQQTSANCDIAKNSTSELQFKIGKEKSRIPPLSTTIISGQVQRENDDISCNSQGSPSNSVLPNNSAFFQAASTPTKDIGSPGDEKEAKSNINYEVSASKINPFDSCAETFMIPAVSPSLFKEVVSPSKQVEKEFKWSIEQMSLLNPAPIEEQSMYHAYESPHDPEYEKKVQQAIDTFFDRPSILPSPWTNSSVKSSTQEIKSSQFKRSVNTPCGSTPRIVNSARSRVLSGPPKTHSSTNGDRPSSCTVGSQTELCLPPILPAALEKALAPYFHPSENVSLYSSSYGNASLCRRLLFTSDELSYCTPPPKPFSSSGPSSIDRSKRHLESPAIFQDFHKQPNSVSSECSPILSGIHFSSSNRKDGSDTPRKVHFRSSTSPHVASMKAPPCSPISFSPFTPDPKNNTNTPPIQDMYEEEVHTPFSNNTGPKYTTSPALHFGDMFGGITHQTQQDASPRLETKISPIKLSPIRSYAIDDPNDPTHELTSDNTLTHHASTDTVVCKEEKSSEKIIFEADEASVTCESTQKNSVVSNNISYDDEPKTPSRQLRKRAKSDESDLQEEATMSQFSSSPIRTPISSSSDTSSCCAPSSSSSPSFQSLLERQMSPILFRHSGEAPSDRNGQRERDSQLQSTLALPHKLAAGDGKNVNPPLKLSSPSNNPHIKPIDTFSQEIAVTVDPSQNNSAVQIPPRNDSPEQSFLGPEMTKKEDFAVPSSSEPPVEVSFYSAQSCGTSLSSSQAILLTEDDETMRTFSEAQLSSEETSQDTGYQTASLLVPSLNVTENTQSSNLIQGPASALDSRPLSSCARIGSGVGLKVSSGTHFAKCTLDSSRLAMSFVEEGTFSSADEKHVLMSDEKHVLMSDEKHVLMSDEKHVLMSDEKHVLMLDAEKKLVSDSAKDAKTGSSNQDFVFKVFGNTQDS